MRQLLLDVAPTVTPTLANFLPGRNSELYFLFQHILSGQERERFIYLWGNPGCGKSHLLRAIVYEYLKNNLSAKYLKCRSCKHFNIDHAADCVAIDDVELLDAANQIKLFNLYNQIRDEEKGLLLVSGSVAPSQLALRRDLVTRLGWGLVYQVHELTDDEKIQAMQHYATRCGFELTQEICLYLLRRVQRDLSTLIDIIDALNRYSLSSKRQITLALLRKILHETS